MAEGSLAWDVLRALGEAVLAAVFAAVLTVAGGATGGFVGFGLFVLAAGFALGAVLRVVGVVLALGVVAALLPFKPIVERIDDGRLADVKMGIVTCVGAALVALLGVVLEGVLGWAVVGVAAVGGLGGANLILGGAISRPIQSAFDDESGSPEERPQGSSHRSGRDEDEEDEDERDVSYHDIAGVDLSGIARERTSSTAEDTETE